MRMTVDELIAKHQGIERQALPFASGAKCKRQFSTEQEEIIISFYMREEVPSASMAEWVGLSRQGFYNLIKRFEKREDLSIHKTYKKRRRSSKVSYRFKRIRKTNGQ